MRLPTLILLLLLGVVQFQLWLGDGGLPQVHRLQAQLAAQKQRNASQKQANDRLVAEVQDLREGLEMVEERARADLGMVKPDEILVQYAPSAAPASAATGATAGGAARTPSSPAKPASSAPQR